MISLITVCYDKQEMLDQTLPLWMAQKKVDLEILIAVGPTIKRIEDPRVKYFTINKVWNHEAIEGGICEAFNLVWPQAKGEQVFITYSDMLMPNPRHLADMLKYWKPGTMVNHDNWGVWTHGMMVDRDLIVKSKGWDNNFDGGYAYEDSDFVHGLLNAGGTLNILKERKDGLKHIDHPRPPDNAFRNGKYVRNKMMYHSKHPVSLMELLESGKFRIVD